MKITFASKLKGDPVVIGMERWKFDGYQPAVHSMSKETRYEIIEEVTEK